MKSNEVVREEKFAMIRRWQESEIRQKQFAEQENISMNNFQYWLKRYRKINEPARGQGRKKPEKFIQLPTTEKDIFSGNIFSEIFFANGNRIKFYESVEISELKQLVR